MEDGLVLPLHWGSRLFNDHDYDRNGDNRNSDNHDCDIHDRDSNDDHRDDD